MTTREHDRLLVAATVPLAVAATVAVVAFAVVDARPSTPWTAWALWVVWFTPLWILPAGILVALDLLAWATRGAAPQLSWVAAGLVLGSVVALSLLVAVVAITLLLA